jgi:hypothetical protein
MKTLLFTTIGIFVSDQLYDLVEFNTKDFIIITLEDGQVWLNRNYVIYIKLVTDEELEKMKVMSNRKIEVPDLNMKGRLN